MSADAVSFFNLVLIFSQPAGRQVFDVQYSMFIVMKSGIEYRKRYEEFLIIIK